ncbi:Lipase precursor [Gemmata obscuriglobus]|uniref:Thioesterase n=1 Tax=Gemmata obscuriglobus TaxID=114 RepID=A0A2Z3GWE2_9BACT|nr:alpha/beta fold hydrolase [Gemmata obscuriglobus]AWM36921.1 thioesterase [Gemmata obscuriglobus]QEG30400.1 Lipase precursor [Gemmata obscuriglobus]VTS09724.1 triacylglycerol lipase : Putative esterase OS=uncultured microorganism PE=4 SV=1: PGAP1 [Gemmata obscuriglobus UQM 2246]
MTANDIPQLGAPIVLVHGLCGYDRVTAFGRPLKDYFPGIRPQLEASGNRVLMPRLSCTRGVAERAGELKRYLLANVPSGPVHLIGHSMGGLDARYMISHLGMADRVRTLTTVGTPHRGSPFADWGLKRFGGLLAPFFQLLGLSTQAFFDLTSAVCARFNATVRDVPGVRYFSVAGVCDGPLLGSGWRLPHEIVRRAEGANDGVVSVASATWGEHTDVWDGDHLNLVNWPNREARKRGVWDSLAPDYGRIIRRIATVE